MTELNSLKPTIIETIGGFSFKLHVDGTGFGAFTGTGLVENVKVPKTVKYHSLRESLKNPVASSAYGMLETPDLRYWGRSEQLHLAYLGIFEFQRANGRLPGESDFDTIFATVKRINESHKDGDALYLEEIDEKVIRNASIFSKACLSPLAAFFGGVVAQEIVKFTGKYSPLKQWLHYDIFETLPRTEVNRTPLNSRYDD